MRIFARGMKWTGLLIMAGLVILGAVKSDTIKAALSNVPLIGDIVNK